MCDRLDAVREVRRAAQELTAACTASSIADVYSSVLAEPVPAAMLELLKGLTTESPFARSRRRR